MRVEFFGDDVDRIAYFDAESQRSGEGISSVTVLPAYEVILDAQAEKRTIAEIDKLINEEWHTEFEENTTGELRFSGFYGDYEIELTADGTAQKHRISLTTETTGYDNRLGDFRSKNIIVE